MQTRRPHALYSVNSKRQASTPLSGASLLLNGSDLSGCRYAFIEPLRPYPTCDAESRSEWETIPSEPLDSLPIRPSEDPQVVRQLCRDLAATCQLVVLNRTDAYDARVRGSTGIPVGSSEPGRS